MNENKFNGEEYNQSIEKNEPDEDGLTIEQREQADYFLALYSETVIPEEERKDCEIEVSVLENLFESFEQDHSLEALLSITELTPEESKTHPIRTPAREALELMTPILDYLKEETNIANERHETLVEKYKQLSRAVGFINNNKVRH